MLFNSSKLILSALLLLLCTSCSNIKLGWDHFERLSMFYLDDYLNVSSEDKSEIKKRIARLKQDHASQILPRASDYLESWVTSINSESLEQPTVKKLIQESEEILKPLKEQVAAESLQVVLQMDVSEREHLVGRIAKKLSERQKRDDKEVEKKMVKRFTSNMKRFFGGVEKTQEATLKAAQDLAKEDQKNVISCNFEALVEFKKVIRQDEKAIGSFLNSYFVTPEKIRSKICNDIYEKRQDRWAQTIAQLHPLLSLKQKKHFQAQALEWQQDLQTIYKKEIARLM